MEVQGFKQENRNLYSNKAMAREVKISDVFRSDGHHFFAIILDGLLIKKTEKKIQIGGFEDFKNHMGCNDIKSCLSDVRRFGMRRAGALLIEGERIFPSLFWVLLARIDTAFATMEKFCFDEKKIEKKEIYQLQDEINEGGWEEIIISSQNKKWIMRMRDDDALIFLSIEKKYASIISNMLGDSAIQIGGDFHYA